jgi:hypothetical protein
MEVYGGLPRGENRVHFGGGLMLTGNTIAAVALGVSVYPRISN